MDYYSAPRQFLRQVRQLVYPRRCPFCDRVLGSVPACPDCAEERESLRRKPGMRLDASQHYLGDLTGAAAPFRYEGCVRRGILHAKYQGAPWAAVELGVVLAELAFGSVIELHGAEPVPQKVEGAALGYDCIVPVPASGTKRGYNVPERMALPLAKALELPPARRHCCRPVPRACSLWHWQRWNFQRFQRQSVHCRKMIRIFKKVCPKWLTKSPHPAIISHVATLR